MEASVAMSALAMEALVSRLAQGTGGLCRLFGVGATLVAEMPLAIPAGAVVDGELVLSPSLEGVALVSMTPTVAQILDADGVVLITAAARLGSASDAGEPVVVGGPTATSVVTGVMVQVTGGTISLLPA